MRARLVVGLLTAAAWCRARPAAAEDARDPRDLFGLGGPRPAAPDEPADPCAAPDAHGCVSPADPLDAGAPYALETYLPAAHLARLPLANLTHDVLAGLAVGVAGGPAGLVIGGATQVEHRWTIEGAPADSVRAGVADTRVPRSFLAGLRVTAGGFAARDRASTGGTIDAELVRGGDRHVVLASAWGGLSADATRRPSARGSYSVRRLTRDPGPEASASLVAHGPLRALGDAVGGRAWYAAGVAPALASEDLAWPTGRVVDADGDGVPDGLPGEVRTEALSARGERAVDYLVPVLLRAGVERGVHSIDVTVIGQAQRTPRFLGNATPRAAGIDRGGYVGDAVVTWRGRWEDARARVQLAWHRSDLADAARDPAGADAPQRLTAYVPTSLPDDPALAAACHDGSSPSIEQCPVPFGWFASGGAGALDATVADRPTATAEVAHRRGRHVVRAGGTLEDARLVTTTRLTGGEQQRSLFDGHLERLRFLGGACEEIAGGPCAYADRSTLTYRTRYAAAFVQDTWAPDEQLRVDAGVRWELMWVGPYLHFSNQLAPRLGVAWDPLGRGRSRVWASMGRSYAHLPAIVGATVIRRDPTVRDTSSPLGESRSTDVGAPFVVAEGAGPIAQDELTAGVEVGLPGSLRLLAWAQGRYLRRGLETVDGRFDNPGRAGGLPALRATELVAAELALAPTARLLLRAGYLYGRTVGTYPGPYDPREGATFHDAEAFDRSYATGAAYGPLPTDLGHRVFVEGARAGRIGALTLDVATRVSVASGRPRSTLGVTDVGVVPLLGWGDRGRGPLQARVDARLAARWRGLAVTLDVFNVFDQRTATAVDELLSGDVLLPVEGGGAPDLVFAKDRFGAPATRRTAFELPLGFQGPVGAVLGVHQTF